MKLEFVPKFITLSAGAVVCIITIVKDMDVTYSLEVLLATLVIFYIIGLLAKKVIQKVMDGNMFVKRQKAEESGQGVSHTANSVEGALNTESSGDEQADQEQQK